MLYQRGIDRERGRLTDYGFPPTFLVHLKCTYAVTNEERQVEEILDRLCEILRIDDELEEVDLADGFKDFSYLGK